MVDEVQCATGCAIEGTIELALLELRAESVRFAWSARALCAGAPEAHVGDSCSGPGSCEPTRARLNPDGTVASQTYLACGGGSCTPIDGPVTPRYLEACDAATVAQYGVPGARGVVVLATGEACLIAWDDAAQAASSGVSRACISDGQCPEGALCDDEIPLLSATTAPRVPVCKPGPRGTLTPAMLAR